MRIEVQPKKMMAWEHPIFVRRRRIRREKAGKEDGEEEIPHHQRRRRRPADEYAQNKWIDSCSYLLLLVVILVFVHLPHQQQTLLVRSQSLDFGFYDRLRNSSAATFQRISQNVDVFLVEDTTTQAATELGFCHLVGISAFSLRNATTGELVARPPDTYKNMVATLLAIQHFNTGNGTVVKELQGINETCPVRFTVEYMDTEFTIFTGLADLTDVVQRDSEAGELYPCAIVGAQRSSVTEPTSTLSSVHNLVQMSATATSSELNFYQRYPFFARVVPSDDASAFVAALYLQEVAGVDNIAVMYVNDSFGRNFALAFQRIATEFGYGEVRSFSVPVLISTDEDRAVLENTIRDIGETEFRYVLAIIFLDQYEDVMTAAYEREIVGPEYQWFFGGGGIETFLDGRSYPRNSPLEVASRGVGIFQEEGGRSGYFGYDAFRAAWRTLNDDDVEYFNSRVPPPPPETIFQAGPGFFQTEDPEVTSGFAYDTIAMMGMAACQSVRELNSGSGSSTGGAGQGETGTGTAKPADQRGRRRAQQQQQDEGEPTSASSSSVRWFNLTYFWGQEHHGAILEMAEFEGASGLVRLDNLTRTREPVTAFYGIKNAIPKDSADGKTVTFEVVEALTLIPNGVDWDLTETREFVYSDGTTVPPPDLPVLIVDMNFLGGLVVIGGFLCGAILSSAIAFLTWRVCRRTSRVVRASQPAFLGMINLGAFMLAVTIIPASIDDQRFSEETCTRACRAIPWFLLVGFSTAISALFSKAYALGRIARDPERYTRMKMTQKEIIVPLVIITLVNFVMLLVWTILYPMEFNRHPTAGLDRFGRNVASIGRCSSPGWSSGGRTSMYFLIPVLVFDLSILLWAMFNVYRGRNIHTEFNETKYVYLMVAAVLELLVLGIPVMFLVRQLSDILYLVQVFFLVGLSGTMLFLTFIPKVYYYRQMEKQRKEHEEYLRRKRQRRQDAQDGAAAPAQVTENADAHGATLEEHYDGDDDDAPDDADDGLKFAVVFDSLIDERLLARKETGVDDRNIGPKMKKSISEVLNQTEDVWN